MMVAAPAKVAAPVHQSLQKQQLRSSRGGESVSRKNGSRGINGNRGGRASKGGSSSKQQL